MTDAERIDFETSMRAAGWPGSCFLKRADGKYVDWGSNDGFHAWQVAHAHYSVRLTALEAQVAELKNKVVLGFYEEEHPIFQQGYESACELSSEVTAAECAGYIDTIKRLSAQLRILAFAPDGHPSLENILAKATAKKMFSGLDATATLEGKS